MNKLRMKLSLFIAAIAIALVAWAPVAQAVIREP
jgi:hypothetical protein